MRPHIFLLTAVLLLVGSLPARSASDEDKPVSLKRPVNAPIKQSFGPVYHPVLKRTNMNLGVMFEIVGHLPVRAVTHGVVREVNTTIDGMLVIIQHPQGYESRYGHLTDIVIAPGDSVQKGFVIGYIDAEHGESLYYEFRYRGNALDPVPFFEEE